MLIPPRFFILRNVAMNSSRVGSGEGARALDRRERVLLDERRVYLLGLESRVDVDGAGDGARGERLGREAGEVVCCGVCCCLGACGGGVAVARLCGPTGRIPKPRAAALSWILRLGERVSGTAGGGAGRVAVGAALGVGGRREVDATEVAWARAGSVETAVETTADSTE